MIWLEFWHCWCGSRSSFGRVIVIITRVFSYMGFHRPRILRGQVVENGDMAAVLAPQVCSRSSFTGVRVPSVRILPYKGALLGGVRRVHLDGPRCT